MTPRDERAADAERAEAAAAPARLRRLPSWLLNRAARRATLLVAAQLGEAGARRPHYTVLLALAEDGPASQADLGRRLGMDRSDMAAVVAELERDGLLTRERDPADRRRNVVALADAGRAALEDLDARVGAAQEELLAPLSRRERAELTRLLAAVVEHDGDGPATG